MVKSGTKLDPVDLSSDVPPGKRHLVAMSGTKLGPVYLGAYIHSVETSSGHELYYVGQLDIW